MTSAAPKRGKLAYKFLFWFLLISLAPMGIVGWHLVNISQNVLKEESLRNQESLAVGFAETVHNYVTTFKNVLLVASRLEGFAAMDALRQERHLDRVMQQHPAFLELSVFDLNGQERVRRNRFLAGKPEPRNFYENVAFQTAVQRGEYVGGLSRFQGLYPTLTIAVPVIETAANGATLRRGVLLGKISLNGLSQMLHQEFPHEDRSQAGVLAGDVKDSFLVAHSNPSQVYRPNASAPEEIRYVVMSQNADKGGGRIALKDGSSVLAAFAQVKDMGWIVYVVQPIETAYLAADQMRRQIAKVFFWVVFVTLLLSLAVAGHITQPIRLLRAAADRLKAGQFEDMPDVIMTNDEIGDLAQSFLQMSDSLKEKTGELVHAKEELEKFTQFLEKRVEARTRELRAAQDELIKKERLAAIGQMASVVGHEIRNPLAVINNSIFFIKTKMAKDQTLDQKIDRHISIIQSEVKQANSIIDEILTYSRTRELKPEVISLNKFLEELLSVYPFPSHVQQSVGFDPRDPVVHIDQDEMRQALRNLIGNAIEVMPKGGVCRVATEIVDKDWVRIDVGDSGPGIPADVLDKIFTAFFTTKARGTGLGLAVVRKVLDRHKGKVDVKTAPGKGTVFNLYLPLSAKASGPAQAAQPQAQPAPAPGPLTLGEARPHTAVRRLDAPQG